MKLIFLIIFFYLFACTTPQTPQEPGKINDVKKTVSAQGGLRMRETADVNGKLVILIPNNSEVELIEEKKIVIEISGKKGKWSKVRFAKFTGWVFGSFF